MLPAGKHWKGFSGLVLESQLYSVTILIWINLPKCSDIKNKLSISCILQGSDGLSLAYWVGFAHMSDTDRSVATQITHVCVSGNCLSTLDSFICKMPQHSSEAMSLILQQARIVMFSWRSCRIMNIEGETPKSLLKPPLTSYLYSSISLIKASHVVSLRMEGCGNTLL